MRARYRFFGRAATLALTVAAAIGACAEGSDIDEPPGTSGPDAGTGGGSDIPPGQIGGPCSEQADCVEGTCTQVGADKICTKGCPPTCPAKTYCAIIDGEAICVPDLGQLCLPCTGAVNCKNPSDQCLTAPLGDKFCAIDCTTMGNCPNGFTCMDMNVYLSGGGGPDAGADGGSDAGGSDAGAGGTMDGGSGDGGPADGGMDAGPPKPSAPTKYCVPNSGFSCPCNEKRDDVKRSCKVENESGLCSGSETCDGEAGKWVGCTAQTPSAEACNGKDDDCDQGIDEGAGDDLCAAEGPPPPNAGWECNAGVCSVGPCEPGFTKYPPGGAPEDGCPCPVEMGEPNDTCASATDAGSVSDGGGVLTLNGTLSSDTDVDVYVLTTVDTAEVSTNSYHVSIDLTEPAQNAEFQLDVTRGPMCSDAPSGPSSGITSYDWCVDGSFVGPNGAMGEAPCGPQGTVHCADHTSIYYVHVSRKPGATGTCTPYVVTITAKGGDPCDFASSCQ